MGFSVKQKQALRASLDPHYIRTREANGRELSYIEGWYAISQANRIFGFDGWNRETVESRCVLARENRGSFLAVYIARVRITVQAKDAIIVREGHGTGEGRGGSAGDAHDTAFKAAETDATKRARATFGKPFGLELYRGGYAASARSSAQGMHSGAVERTGFHPDDTTPIPRPSRYHGQRQTPPLEETVRKHRRTVQATPSPAPPLAPVNPNRSSNSVDKSRLAIAEPKRLRDKAHLQFVASHACLICGRQPCDPHHVRHAQPRALGQKVSDEFTVPLCRGHHRQLHQTGDEVAWWREHKIDPLKTARELWEQSRAKSGSEHTR
jgi:DNA recombination protein Rad52